MIERLCKKCEIPKPIGEFVKNKRLKDGHGYTCLRCVNDNNKKWRQTNPERQKAWNAAYIAKDVIKDRKLRYKFNITLEQFNELLNKQNGKCALCDEAFTRRICVDHDHACCSGHGSCGKCIRGLLCSCCNLGLGYFKDDPKKLSKAIEYVTKVT